MTQLELPFKEEPPPTDPVANLHDHVLEFLRVLLKGAKEAETEEQMNKRTENHKAIVEFVNSLGTMKLMDVLIHSGAIFQDALKALYEARAKAVPNLVIPDKVVLQ